MEDLWKKFQDALKNYTDATEDRKIAFEALKVKDEKSSKEIETQMKKIQRLQVSARSGGAAGAVRCGCLRPSSPDSFGALPGWIKVTDWVPSPRSVSPLTCLSPSIASSVPPGVHKCPEREDRSPQPRRRVAESVCPK